MWTNLTALPCIWGGLMLSQMQSIQIKYSVSTFRFVTNANNKKKSNIQFRRYFCHKKNSNNNISNIQFRRHSWFKAAQKITSFYCELISLLYHASGGLMLSQMQPIQIKYSVSTLLFFVTNAKNKKKIKYSVSTLFLSQKKTATTTYQIFSFEDILDLKRHRR